MAGVGTKGSRPKRTSPKARSTVLQADAKPKNPPPLPGYAEYAEPVREWWDTWIDAPQASLFTKTDWRRLIMLAPLVERYYKSADERAFNAIIRGEALLGCTPLDRLRLGWEIAGEHAETHRKLENVTDPRYMKKAS